MTCFGQQNAAELRTCQFGPRAQKGLSAFTFSLGTLIVLYEQAQISLLENERIYWEMSQGTSAYS